MCSECSPPTPTEYGLPIDDAELDRIDMCHAKYYALLEKKRFLAPIGDNPHKILDLGCGTGKSALSTPHVLCHGTAGPGAMAGR